MTVSYKRMQNESEPSNYIQVCIFSANVNLIEHDIKFNLWYMLV